MKKVSLILLFGFLFGSALAGFFSPSMISWYFNPPAAIGVSCQPAVVWGIGAYQKILVIGGFVGMALTAGILIAIKVKKRPILPA